MKPDCPFLKAEPGRGQDQSGPGWLENVAAKGGASKPPFPRKKSAPHLLPVPFLGKKLSSPVFVG